MDSLRIIFAGSGEFGLPTLRSLLGSRHQVVQVVSQPDRPSGRGRKLMPTPIAALAIEASLPLLRTASINTEALLPADVLVVIAFGQKISTAIVDAPRYGAVNLHASLLPKYRGAAPINWSLINGDPITGNSIIRLADRMDAGAVLARSDLTIGELETAGEVHDRLSLDGAPLMLRVLDELQSGHATEIPQDESLATIAPKLNRESARLDFSMPAQEITRRIHGLYPWPGCRVRLVDSSGEELDRLTLVRARAGDCREGRWEPGELTLHGHVHAAGTSVLEIVEVQPQGKRPMPLEAYRRGHRWTAGLRLESIV